MEKKKIVIREEKDGVSISGNVSGSMSDCLNINFNRAIKYYIGNISSISKSRPFSSAESQQAISSRHST